MQTSLEQLSYAHPDVNFTSRNMTTGVAKVAPWLGVDSEGRS